LALWTAAFPVKPGVLPAKSLWHKGLAGRVCQKWMQGFHANLYESARITGKKASRLW
jgi:hypothetical protein